jgi:ACR3 family arsenite transporter
VATVSLAAPPLAPGQAPAARTERRLGASARYLSLWVALAMVGGVALGKRLPEATAVLRGLEFGRGSHVNVAIAVLIWLMIVPMMMKVDFGAIRSVGRRPRGLLVTLAVNWLVKPFSMALLAWLFFKHLFAPWIGPSLADQYLAGAIILAAAPCTAMVFVWSYLTDGDPAYTLVQVALNDLIMLVLFAPIVRLLVSGTSSLAVPFSVLLWSVALFIAIPLAAGTLLRAALLRWRGAAWFEGTLLHVLLIAVPVTLQVYFNASLAYGLMHRLRVPFAVAAPGALIGASNFFELAVATAIALFGPGSGAALATVVGVLVEVPVMLSVCSACNRTRGWFAAERADT